MPENKTTFTEVNVTAVYRFWRDISQPQDADKGP